MKGNDEILFYSNGQVIRIRRKGEFQRAACRHEWIKGKRPKIILGKILSAKSEKDRIICRKCGVEKGEVKNERRGIHKKTIRTDSGTVRSESNSNINNKKGCLITRKELEQTKHKITLEQYKAEGGSYLFIDSSIFHDFDTYVDSLRDWSKEDLEDYQLPIIYGGTVEKIRIYPEHIIEALEESDEAYEDYEVDEAGKDFIRAFAKEYNDKYAGESVWKNEKQIIVLSEEEVTEIRTVIFKALEKL